MVQWETVENICSENATAAAADVVLRSGAGAGRRFERFTDQLKLDRVRRGWPVMAEPGRNLQVELCVFHPGVGGALARALLNALDLDRRVTRDG